MKIVVDGMGGDNAPFSTVQGITNAINEYKVDIIVTGDKEILEKELNQPPNVSIQQQSTSFINKISLLLPLEKGKNQSIFS